MAMERPMVKYDEEGEFVAIHCDECDKPNPPTEDLLINCGLIGLGWFCAGGKHLCPDCKEPSK